MGWVSLTATVWAAIHQQFGGVTVSGRFYSLQERKGDAMLILMEIKVVVYFYNDLILSSSYIFQHSQKKRRRFSSSSKTKRGLSPWSLSSALLLARQLFSLASEKLQSKRY